MKTLKTLCVVAALSIAVVASVGASTAAASQLHATTYPTVLSGSGAGGLEHQLKIQAGNIGCKAPSLEAGLTEPSSTVAIYTGNTTCNFWGSPELKMHGCSFTFHFGSDAGHFGRYAGTADIGPAGCGPITLESSACPVSIPSQSGLAVSYENIAGSSPSQVAITAVMSGLEYTQKKASFCKAGTYTDGEYAGTWNLFGTGGHGIYLEEEAHTPAFEAEQYTATISGEQDASNTQTIAVQGQKISCGTIGYSGSLSGAAGTVSVTPSYSSCSAFGFAGATGKANGCAFVLHAGESLGGGKYKGTEDVSCPEGQSLEFIATPTCKVSIPSQTGLGTVEYEDIQKSGKVAIKGSLNVSGLSYTATDGFLCPLTSSGSFTNGSQTGGVFLQGKTGTGTLQGLRIGG